MKNKLTLLIIFITALLVAIKMIHYNKWKNDGIIINIGTHNIVPWSYIDTPTPVLETFGDAVFGSLAYFNEAGQIEPHHPGSLVEEYYCNENKCFVRIKKDVYFHNNRKVSAKDIEFSLLYQFFAQKKSFSDSNLDDLIDIDDIRKMANTGGKFKEGISKSIQIIDDENIVFILKNHNSFFLQKISTSFSPIIPKEELDENFDWKHGPIGFGNYKFISHDVGNKQYVLALFRNLNDAPKHIFFDYSSSNTKIFDISLTEVVPSDQTSNFQKIVFPQVIVNGGFLYNFSTHLGSDINFRQAISLALDREKISNCTKIGNLYPNDQLLPHYGLNTLYRESRPLIKQDLQKAKSHLSLVPEKLWRDKTFSVHTFWTINQDVDNVCYFNEIKNQLHQIGINIVFKKTDFNYTWFKDDDPNVLWWTGFDTGTNEPTANFAYFKMPSFFRHGFPNDSKYIDLYNKAVKEINNGTYAMKELSKYFNSMNYMTVVFDVKKTVLYNSNKIKTLGNQNSSVKIIPWKIIMK